LIGFLTSLSTTQRKNNMRKIDKHIIHCSDSTFGDVKIIRGWHVKGNGWDDIGYHFVIGRDGEIELGRLLSEAGAHCYGQNGNSVGTCLIGRDEFTKEQFKALRKLDRELKDWFPDIETFPHNHFNPDKTCPVFDVEEVLR